MSVSRIVGGALACSALVTASCSGQVTENRPERLQPDPEFAWISGHWVRDTDSRRVEEIWTAADGVLMTGMNRTVRADGRTAFEYMRIEFTDPPVFVAQPSGGAPVRFTWVAGSEASALFANPDHDFPTHIEYARSGDTLSARIWGPDGEAEAIGWSWELDRP